MEERHAGQSAEVKLVEIGEVAPNVEGSTISTTVGSVEAIGGVALTAERPARWYHFDGVRIAQGYNMVGDSKMVDGVSVGDASYEIRRSALCFLGPVLVDSNRVV